MCLYQLVWCHQPLHVLDAVPSGPPRAGQAVQPSQLNPSLMACSDVEHHIATRYRILTGTTELEQESA